MSTKYDYHETNAMLNLRGPNGELQLEKDRLAARQFFLNHVNQNTVFFHNLREKLEYLVTEKYYDPQVLDMYTPEFLERIFHYAAAKKFRFPTFLGAFKYYTSYTLKTLDGTRYLERYEDRVVMTALYLALGDENFATELVDEIIAGRYQPATPTFLNAGKLRRGEMVSCFLLRVEDNMESISRSVHAALQLSKRGGGVAMNLTSIRETGAPIKGIEGQSSGVIPVMKMLEDAFSYANQLGARQGSGAVYLNAHHPDVFKFLDTKKENADEKIRIKTLSLGLVIPDITFELARDSKPMYLFSPHDVFKVYGKPMSDISITECYWEMVDNPAIRKSKIDPREFFQRIAEIQFESGYPYIMFEDTVNKANPIKGRINMSNLCTEILQVNTPSEYNSAADYTSVGKDISCNLGSMNILAAFKKTLPRTIELAIRALTSVSDQSDISCVPSIDRGNKMSHAIGLGQMNLHGFFANNLTHYDSAEALDFTNMYFYTVAYHALKTSNQIAIERGQTFEGFEDSKYASGEFFTKYLEQKWEPRTDRIRTMFAEQEIHIPTQQDWFDLCKSVQAHGIYNQNLLAIPPTGSISYINNSTSSIHPVVAPIEIRKEGKVGRVYYPAPGLSEETLPFYKTAYDYGPKAVIDIYAEATQHTDQGLSCVLFFYDTATTRDVNKAQIYAWKKGLKTVYYVRLRQDALEGTEVEGCVSCSL